MKTILHLSSSRGYANRGWLKSHHTFSFANYYDPQRVQFGMLRVLNDDEVVGSMGFDKHPHENMEIVSIPLSGDLEHRDSMGNVQVIREHDVQVMSAGTGIQHSEYNKSKDHPVSFLQIWVFPKVKNIEPRYDQKTFPPAERHNKIQTIVSPEKNGGAVWINQDAWFSLADADADTILNYTLHNPAHGVYIFVLEGSVAVAEHLLHHRDGLGVTGVSSLSLSTAEKCSVLLIEVPMA